MADQKNEKLSGGSPLYAEGGVEVPADKALVRALNRAVSEDTEHSTDALAALWLRTVGISKDASPDSYPTGEEYSQRLQVAGELKGLLDWAFRRIRVAEGDPRGDHRVCLPLSARMVAWVERVHSETEGYLQDCLKTRSGAGYTAASKEAFTVAALGHVLAQAEADRIDAAEGEGRR